MHVLFVCTGNTCRSPMAEAILTKTAKEKGLSVHCDSAGIFASLGQKISNNARTALLEDYGIPWDGISKPVTKELLEKADLVVAVTENHKNLLLQAFGAEKKVISLPTDVGDPYGGDTAAYKKAAKEIEKGLLILLEEGAFYD